ncbi:ogr/Delta-like zinc finger family protein [Paraburkholderia sp. B3]|uniref:ogr/Delta-like zinc finger family protein n=1 Tax=Paraburkholderia sp. B3 TaxID=3134791 RepID=UPI0039822436
MRITIRCPHCGTRPIARTSREMSGTLRELTYMCQDPECGHTYVANLEIVRTLSPSAKPNPAIRIPFSPHVRERIMKQLELTL